MKNLFRSCSILFVLFLTNAMIVEDDQTLTVSLQDNNDTWGIAMNLDSNNCKEWTITKVGRKSVGYHDATIRKGDRIIQVNENVVNENNAATIKKDLQARKACTIVLEAVKADPNDDSDEPDESNDERTSVLLPENYLWGIRVSLDKSWDQWKIIKVIEGQQGDLNNIKKGYRIIKVNDVEINESNAQKIKTDYLKEKKACKITFKKENPVGGENPINNQDSTNNLIVNTMTFGQKDPIEEKPGLTDDNLDSSDTIKENPDNLDDDITDPLKPSLKETVDEVVKDVNNLQESSFTIQHKISVFTLLLLFI